MSFLPAFFDASADGGARVRTAFLLHGFFGSGRNWRTFSGDLAAALPHLRVVVVDLRNHGNSVGAPPPHTLAACADDLRELARKLGVTPDVVIGHSFGGKVALAYARVAEGLRTLISLDSSPGRANTERALASTAAGRVLGALRSLPMPVQTRAEIAPMMAKLGIDPNVARWMATNLRPQPGGGYAWHFDANALTAMLEDYRAFDGWPLLEHPPQGVAMHFVRAANSDHYSRAEIERLDALAAAGTVALHVLPDAGHWLQVDNPKGLLELLTRILRQAQ